MPKFTKVEAGAGLGYLCHDCRDVVYGVTAVAHHVCNPKAAPAAEAPKRTDFVNVVLFAKPVGEPERRVAEFLTSPRRHVYVESSSAFKHDPTGTMDAVTINVAHLAAVGVEELRIEVEQRD